VCSYGSGTPSVATARCSPACAEPRRARVAVRKMSGGVAAVFAGRYRVVRRLGAGGSGAVFLAHDERLSRDVAVKRLHGGEVTAETAQRLRREARIMAALRHPGLVTVYDMLTDEDDVLLVMEYVRGETLAEVLADAPLEWDRIAGPLDQVAAALDYVHEQGVVHRDLKPSNILVASSGSVKIADLGLATAAEITNITPPGTILGTPAYMAPEQARGVTCTPAVDVFALGTIVFQALAGTPTATAAANGTPDATATHEPAAAATPAANATPAASPKRMSATATVRTFYRRAADGDFAGAWRLAGPGMRRAFGDSLDQFTRDLSSLQLVEFQDVSVVGRDQGAVTVEIRTVATHVDHVDRCSGRLRTVRGSDGRWLVEPAGVQCTRG
jgi:protein kinase-like protein